MHSQCTSISAIVNESLYWAVGVLSVGSGLIGYGQWGLTKREIPWHPLCVFSCLFIPYVLCCFHNVGIWVVVIAKFQWLVKIDEVCVRSSIGDIACLGKPVALNKPIRMGPLISEKEYCGETHWMLMSSSFHSLNYFKRVEVVYVCILLKRISLFGKSERKREKRLLLPFRPYDDIKKNIDLFFVLIFSFSYFH